MSRNGNIHPRKPQETIHHGDHSIHTTPTNSRERDFADDRRKQGNRRILIRNDVDFTGMPDFQST